MEYPESSAANALMALNVEAGAVAVCTARLSRGCPASGSVSAA